MSNRYPILAAALAFGDFTIEQISERTGIQIASVTSVLRREARVEEVGRAQAGRSGGGRAKIYRIRPDAVEEVFEEIERLFQEILHASATPGSENLELPETYWTALAMVEEARSEERGEYRMGILRMAIPGLKIARQNVEEQQGADSRTREPVLDGLDQLLELSLRAVQGDASLDEVLERAAEVEAASASGEEYVRGVRRFVRQGRKMLTKEPPCFAMVNAVGPRAEQLIRYIEESIDREKVTLLTFAPDEVEHSIGDRFVEGMVLLVDSSEALARRHMNEVIHKFTRRLEAPAMILDVAANSNLRNEALANHADYHIEADQLSARAMQGLLEISFPKLKTQTAQREMSSGAPAVTSTTL